MYIIQYQNCKGINDCLTHVKLHTPVLFNMYFSGYLTYYFTINYLQNFERITILIQMQNNISSFILSSGIIGNMPLKFFPNSVSYSVKTSDNNLV